MLTDGPSPYPLPRAGEGNEIHCVTKSMSSMRISARAGHLRSAVAVERRPDSSCHCRPTSWPGIGFTCVTLPVKPVNANVNVCGRGRQRDVRRRRELVAAARVGIAAAGRILVVGPLLERLELRLERAPLHVAARDPGREPKALNDGRVHATLERRGRRPRSRPRPPSASGGSFRRARRRRGRWTTPSPVHRIGARPSS